MGARREDRTLLHQFWRCIAGVWKLSAAKFGALFTVIGALQQYANIATIPSWVWWLAAILALAATAFQIQWQLLEENDKNRKPRPDMALDSVLKRIRRKDDIFGPQSSESMEVGKAFRRIEEHALTGELVVFGVPGLRYVPEAAKVDAIVKRVPIPRDAWQKHSFDYTALLQDRSGRIAPDDRHKDGFGTGWAYIWFDEHQIDAIWPRPRKTIDWRNPFRFRDV